MGSTLLVLVSQFPILLVLILFFPNHDYKYVYGQFNGLPKPSTIESKKHIQTSFGGIIVMELIWDSMGLFWDSTDIISM